MELPTLYKLTATGAIQKWEISVSGSSIKTRYGQQGGKIQETLDTIIDGKNTGKKNATSAEEQAQKEAKSKWEKQVKKGYVVALDRARDAETDHEGGIVPMLAHKYSDYAHKVCYPAFCQPKLDGIRCIATITADGVTLWTRTRKPIKSVPHINGAIAALELAIGTVLDGELYNHALRHEFEKIVSLVRSDAPSEGHERVEYHIYDMPSEAGGFKNRYAALPKFSQPLVLVQTLQVQTESDILSAHERATEDGYEGVMVRSGADTPYEGKRSQTLLKIKEFDDAEFPIIGVCEGRGKLAGHAATFTCRTPEGVEFEVKLRGDTEQLRKYFTDHTLWQGKVLTVKYQGMTNTNKVPRFPVGVAIRDYE